jgi:cell division protein FtsW (lipid II flippase)
MRTLAKLGSVVLIALGLVFVYHDVATAVTQSLPNWVWFMGRTTLWRWGLGAVAAGALCAALITIAEALAMGPSPPPPSEPQRQPEKAA